MVIGQAISTIAVAGPIAGMELISETIGVWTGVTTTRETPENGRGLCSRDREEDRKEDRKEDHKEKRKEGRKCWVAHHELRVPA